MAFGKDSYSPHNDYPSPVSTGQMALDTVHEAIQYGDKNLTVLEEQLADLESRLQPVLRPEMNVSDVAKDIANENDTIRAFSVRRAVRDQGSRLATLSARVMSIANRIEL